MEQQFAANNLCFGVNTMRTLTLGTVRFLGFCAVLFSFPVIGFTQSKMDANPANAFYEMTRMAPVAFTNGEFDKAKNLSEALLKDAENWKENWNYGNAIHAANMVLGRIALRNDKADEATLFLRAAGKTPGSPQLNTFGPDMNLAKDFLQKGDKETVLEYFALCSKFWGKRHHDKLDKWTAEIQAGQIPDFGPNLKYMGF